MNVTQKVHKYEIGAGHKCGCNWLNCNNDLVSTSEEDPLPVVRLHFSLPSINILFPATYGTEDRKEEKLLRFRESKLIKSYRDLTLISSTTTVP